MHRTHNMSVYTQIYNVVCALDMCIIIYFVFCVPSVRVTVSTCDFVYFVFFRVFCYFNHICCIGGYQCTYYYIYVQ